MTLPALINKSQKMILKNQFKKTYSTLTQALLNAEIEYGATPLCYYHSNTISSTGVLLGGAITTECKTFGEIFVKNLNIIQTCEGNAYPKGCIPKYKGFENVAMENNPDLSEEEAKEQVRGQPGFHEQNILYKNFVYVLADGTILLEYFKEQSSLIFAVDINGKKGPNKWGYDLFSFFTISNGKSNLTLRGSGYAVEKGGTTTTEMIKNLYNDKK